MASIISDCSALLPILIKTMNATIAHRDSRINILSSDADIKPSQLNAKQKFWLAMLLRHRSSNILKHVLKALVWIRHFQLLIDVLLLKLRISDRPRLAFIAILESIKLCLRLYILKVTEGRGKSTLFAISDFVVLDKTPNNLISVEDKISSSALAISDLVADNLYLKEDAFFFEALYLIRPITSIILLLKLGKKSWIPWVVPLVMELASYYMKSAKAQGRDGTVGIVGYGFLDMVEVNRRLLYLYLYLLREPFFDTYILPFVDAPLGLLRKIPIVGSLVSGMLKWPCFINSTNIASHYVTPRYILFASQQLIN